MARPKSQLRKLSYTYTQAAAVTGLSGRTLRRLGDAGRIRLIRLPGVRTVLLDAASIDALLQQGREAAVNA